MVRSACTALRPSDTRARLLGRRGDELLRAGGRGVAVLHDHQHAVALVEQVGSDAREQAVVPEAAVAHDRYRCGATTSARRRRRSPGSCRSRAACCPARTARSWRRHGSRRPSRRAAGRCPAPPASSPRTPAAPGSRCRRSAAAPAALPSRLPAVSFVFLTPFNQSEPREVSRCGACCARNFDRPRTSDSTLYSPAMCMQSLPCSSDAARRRGAGPSRFPAR